MPTLLTSAYIWTFEAGAFNHVATHHEPMHIVALTDLSGQLIGSNINTSRKYSIERQAANILPRDGAATMPRIINILEAALWS